jgi:hypothetical protein
MDKIKSHLLDLGYMQQERQWTYKVILRRVHAAIVAMEKQVSVCSLRNQACNAHAPYYHLWPAPLYNIFPHYLTNGTIFEKKLLNTKCVWIFCTTFVWNISHSEKKWAGRSGDRIPVVARFSAPDQTGPGAQPASFTMGTGSLSRG